MTDERRNDIRSAVIGLLVALCTAIPGSYVTIQVAQAKFETTQHEQGRRIAELEKVRAQDAKVLTEVASELRVLNERLKRVDDLGESMKRLESKVDTVLVRGENR